MTVETYADLLGSTVALGGVLGFLILASRWMRV